MRILVIGGTGHIGTYLVPSLVRAGHEVSVVTRGRREPYSPDDAWVDVERLTCDRVSAEADGVFGDLVAAQRPDAVVDLTCFTADQARHLTDSLDGQHVVATGSIWAWGRSVVVPMTEETTKHPYGDYGIAKAEVEDTLLRGQDRVRATVIHPGHISGPGWPAINPAGNLDLDVYRLLKRDGAATLPFDGMGLLQHVHAADVAALHQAAVENPSAASGEAFNAVAEQSLTLRGYASLLAGHFGHVPHLTFLPWAQFEAHAGEENARVTADHIDRSPHHSMAKARERLGFVPRYTAQETVLAAVDALLGE